MAVRVIDAVRGRTRIEAASTPFRAGLDRYAVVVHYAASPVLTRSFVTLVAELRANGYFVLISSASPADGDLEWPAQGMPADTLVIRKPNIGYDFGSAAVALDLYPALRSAPFVLIVNDSNVGPFRPLADVVADFESRELDAWALTASNQHSYHLQSFFLGFRNGVLDEPALRRFWRDIRHFDDKRKVIFSYELGLSRLLAAEGYVMDVMFPNSSFESATFANTSVNLWLELLADGYPFVKREMINKPWIEPSAIRAPAVVNYLFGEDVNSWL